MTQVLAGLLLAPPTPAPTPAPADNPIIDVSGIQTFLLSVVGVILLVVIGLFIMSKATKGEASRVMTTSGIAVLGLVFVGGAGVLVYLGPKLVDLIVK